VASKNEIGKIRVTLQLGTEELQAGIRTAERELKKFGRVAQQAGSAISVAFAAGLTGIGVAAVKSFGNFDAAIRRSMAYIDDAGEIGGANFNKLIAGAKQLSERTSISATEAAEAYGVLGQAGLKAGEALSSLPVFADFATAGNLKLAESGEMLIQIQQSLGEEFKTSEERAENFSKIANVIGRASLDTTLSIQDLSVSLASQLGGALRQANVDIETATAILEAFGSQGIKGAKAGTALGIVIRDLGLKYFKKGGINVFDENGNFKNIIGVLKEMEGALDGLSDVDKIIRLKELGFTLKNISFIQSLMGMSQAMSDFEKRNREAGDTIKEIADKIRAGFNEQMKMAANTATNAAIVIGEKLAPAVLLATRLFADFAKWFSELPSFVVNATVATFGIVTALAVLGTTLGIVSSALGSFIGLFQLLLGKTIVADIVKVLAGIGAAIGTLPVIIGVAIVAAGAAIYIFWDDIKEGASSLIGWFKESFPEIFDIVWGVFLTIGDIASKFFENFSKGWQVIKDFVSDVWNGIADFISGKIDAIDDIIDGFIEGFKTKFPKIVPYALDAFEAIKKGAEFLKTALDNAMYPGKMSGSNALGDYIAEALGADEWDKQLADFFKGRAKDERAKQLEEQAKALQKQVDLANTLKNINQEMLSIGSVGSAVEGLPRISSELGPRKEFALGDLAIQREDAFKVQQIAKATGESVENINKALGQGKRTLKETVDELVNNSEETKKTEKAIKKAVDETEKWLSKWKEFRAEQSTNTSQDEIDKILEMGNFSPEDLFKLDELTKGLKKSVEEGFFEQWKEGLKHGIPLSELEEEMKKAGDAAVDEVGNKVDTKVDEMSAKIHENLVNAGEGFISLIGAAGDAFGINLSGITSALGQLSPESKAKIGSTVKDGIGDLFGDDFLNDIGWGSDSADPEAQAAANKEMMDDIQAGLDVAGDIFNASDKDKETKSNAGTGAAAGGAIGAYFGGSTGQKIGSQIGELIGGMLKWGPQNAETQARHAFANFVEEGFEKLKTVAFFDKDKKLKLTKGDQFNFLEGSSDRFNLPGWGDEFNKLDPVIKKTFNGLGMALKETLGLTEEVGSQIAFLLSENLGANVDNARLFVAQLGLSLEDLSNSLIAAGETGAMTWLEVESGLQGLGEAFKPGLAAVGDIAGAWQQLTDSGGRGIAAIKAVQNIAVETLEAGGKTLKDLEAKMLAAGIPAEQVSALMAALAQRQITTLEQLAEVSNRVGGGIVADINAGSETMADNWAKMTEQLEDVSKKLKEIPDEVTSRIHLKVDTEMSEETKKLLEAGVTGVEIPDSTEKFAKGGLLTRKMSFGMSGGGFGLAGEAGPEFIMPATRLPDGSMGIRAVGQGQAKGYPVINLTVNAPNSAPGMEHKIANALDRVRKDMISQTIDIISRHSSQGRG
jgi:TP901 family phage tail tape measure protein